jgi:hypothetical protein
LVETFDGFPKPSVDRSVTCVQSPAVAVRDAGEKASTVGEPGLMVTLWVAAVTPLTVALITGVPALVPLK